MARFIYTLMETDANWIEHLYHTDVVVQGGLAETDDPIAMEGLLYRGFKLIEDVVDEVADVVGDAVDAVAKAVEEVVEDLAGSEDDVEPQELEGDCFHGIPFAEECRECAAEAPAVEEAADVE